MQQNAAKLLMTKHLPQNHARVKSNLFILVTSESSEDDVRSSSNMIHGGPPGANLTS